MKFRLIMICLLMIPFLSGEVFSQRLLTEQQKREHQAVKEYKQQYLERTLGKKTENQVQIPFNVNDKYKLRDEYYNQLTKTANGQDERKSFIMNGNKVQVEITNYGGVGGGYNALREVSGMVWRNASYVFQFGPIIGASVSDPEDPTKRYRIFTDGLWDYPSVRTVNPTGDTLWQWQPLTGYADPDQPYLAHNPDIDSDRDGKPDSWPRHWYNPSLGDYVWPGYLRQGANNADLETLWAMDDRENRRYPYYPFKTDLTRRGLGIQVDGRAFQWNNVAAENVLFVVYTITNVSDYDIDTVVFGIYGDPDIGGGGTENKDDRGFFIPPYSIPGNNVDHIPHYARSMVYFWDEDMTGPLGVKLGYLGCKFLESPGNPFDGIDNDGDGMIDESQDNNIDDDGDWNPETDDVGLDGIPNTGDEGEGDGIPTAGRRLPGGALDPLYPGEPNFELTDLDESDQIGLTSFNSWTWAQDKVSNHESMWNRTIPGNFGDIQQETDIVFVFGSGYITPLRKGEIKRISMAFLFGENLSDLLVTAETVQRIYNENYNFYRPPDLPTVHAVADDKKVTLYWDTAAEESEDKFTGKDFQGYVIYRSTDPGFNDIQTITDGKGAKYLSQPLTDLNGVECRWDLDDGWRGYHPVPYAGRGVHYYLGDNTGLVHSYVDSNNVINGQTYYYAVVAYDHGDSINIPPSETSKKITVDPISGEKRFDLNTVMAIPGPRASGYIAPSIKNENIIQNGYATGDVNFEILNDLAIKDGEYLLFFKDSLKTITTTVKQKNYSILDKEVYIDNVTLYEDKFSKIGRENLNDDEYFSVESKDGTVYRKGIDYEFNLMRGTIRRLDNTLIPDNSEVVIKYRHHPLYQSILFKAEDYNPVFDGIKLTLVDDPILKLNEDKTKWISGNSNLEVTGRLAPLGSRRVLDPADYEITFSSTHIDTALKPVGSALVKIPVKYSVKDVTTGIAKPIITILRKATSAEPNDWVPGDEIVFFKPGAAGSIQDTLTWGITIFNPLDTAIVPIAPANGDVLFIKTDKPFTTNDSYTLVTKAGKISTELAASLLDDIYVVPNPYIGYSELEPPNRLASQSRGERRIYFENLPPKCTIRIFTLSGELVTTINRDASFESGREYWNLLNRDGFSVAYGLYLAHIEAPGIGETIVKFALIK